MKRKMIRLSVLVVLVISLTSCKFKWKPDPYQMGEEGIVNKDGKFIPYTNTEETLYFSCFHIDNLLELKAAIRKCEEKK